MSPFTALSAFAFGLAVTAVLPLTACAQQTASNPVTTPAPAPVYYAGSQAIFQYTRPVTTGDNKSFMSFLWVPPEAKEIRGVFVAGHTVIEREFVKTAALRAVCAEQKLAILFLKGGLMSTDIAKLLSEYAQQTPYAELAGAPMCFIGHSAGGPQAQQTAVKYADRCFGLIQYCGGGPYDGQELAASVPSLMVIAQFDEHSGTMRSAEGREQWMRYPTAMADYRAKNPQRLASLIVQPGAGHFNLSARNIGYMTEFVRAAAAARIPATWTMSGANGPTLITIPATAGWVSDFDLKAPKQAPAAYDKYAGDKTTANWHLTEALAKATVKYHEGLDRKDQFIQWTNPNWVDAGVRYYFNDLKWVDDGQTFEVNPEYRKTYPEALPNGPRWALTGQPVGHSNAPIQIAQVSGPLVPVGTNKLRVVYDALAGVGEYERFNFLAFSLGDQEYRYTEVIGMAPRGFKSLNDGKSQTITFPPLANLKPNSPPMALTATSDAGLPVEYYISYGPAVVKDGKLHLAEVPARAQYPLGVQVVAYQFGKGNAPKVKSAAPVIQVIQIEKP
jgi:hypothetical protein